ncbi:LPS ABC transporter [Streptococcus azizii]|uniref:Transport permease protein n=1 Tax=Streptococcus azizii TaxID=1579424 RepID=A0AB36JKP1_9STRE|nr:MULTISPECIES: ABC transporter permease [Streptococcus]MBF0776534.1 ABC transporter permease [Streptococcus sp. 19428wD3_AN2]ONK26092.1 LPS ABC transporter [Streptococcus azizii]ONK26550.1 LPS ABC transporter [Streptococcus azizii]ONK27417.1 LPS ABC transporter [Streptococcus azizii]TFU82881.1 ABC transporter permease [Streptococcus sp. AN2]
MDIFSKKNRILLKELIKTDFKLRYQGSMIGYLWSILKPLMLFAIMYVVFIHFLRLGGDVPHFPVALLLGNVIWSFFAEATNMGMVSIVTRGDLLRKLNFSKEIIVLSSVFGAAINFSINLIVVLIFSLFNGVEFTWAVIVALPLFLELFMLATGVAFILSTLFVRFRDLAQIWEVVMQAGMYATPIIYSLSFVMDKSLLAAKLIMLNPLAQIIQDMRYFVIDRANIPVWQVIQHKAIVLIPYLIPIIIFVIGTAVFKKHSKKFAEIL